MLALRRAAFSAAIAIFCTLGGCIPERDTTPALYTQYSLSEPESSDGVHCFYDCLRFPNEAERETCLASCDGIALNVTREPCTPPAPRLCTYDPVPVQASGSDDDGSKVAAAIIGGIFKVAIATVTHAGDDDHERAHSSAPAPLEPATHREPRHREPATSRPSPDRRRYVVERPRPDPKPRTPST